MAQIFGKDTPCANQKFFLPLKSSQSIHIKNKFTFFDIIFNII
jgi:hypothetical protein